MFYRVGVPEQGLPSSRDTELVLGPDLLVSLDREADILLRIRTMQDLTPEVKTKRLQNNAVELLWRKIEDLAHGSHDQARHESWIFLEAVIR